MSFAKKFYESDFIGSIFRGRPPFLKMSNGILHIFLSRDDSCTFSQSSFFELPKITNMAQNLKMMMPLL